MTEKITVNVPIKIDPEAPSTKVKLLILKEKMFDGKIRLDYYQRIGWNLDFDLKGTEANNQ